ncbi:DUF805 domain-containing protein [Nitrincola iocasae]|uniref:DUF805 domain-containing protein n=1 Tax=Nitrincola iocasae TaxID=2614693 RepID=A0A5J6LFJ6_9GAMM|nr:DUF805 domain-containing protein [Nitrincola iocasae]QEW07389.1 DUF805 domain-containing protein [Nitrincola iocasae]
MNWYIQALKNYADFSGRARRKEYWFFVLFNFIFAAVLGFVDGLTGSYIPEIGIGILGGIYLLAMFIPSLSVTVRRLHDIDKSGWWLLIAFVPLLGLIVLLVFLFMGSQSDDNRFGANPKVVVA